MRIDTLRTIVIIHVQSAPEEQQSFYRVSDDQPISDHSPLSEALQSACAGLPLHWMKPVSAPDALSQPGNLHAELCPEKTILFQFIMGFLLFLFKSVSEFTPIAEVWNTQSPEQLLRYFVSVAMRRSLATL